MTSYVSYPLGIFNDFLTTLCMQESEVPKVTPGWGVGGAKKEERLIVKTDRQLNTLFKSDPFQGL